MCPLFISRGYPKCFGTQMCVYVLVISHLRLLQGGRVPDQVSLPTRWNPETSWRKRLVSEGAM